MKYLRLALLFGLLGWISPAANAGWGIFQDSTTAAAGCSPATTYLARTTISGSLATAYTTFICGLVTDGLFTSAATGYCGTLFDVVVILWSDTSGNALNNLCAATFTPVNNASVFTTLRGYSGTGSSYVDTSFNPSIGSNNYTLNSAHLSCYVVVEVATTDGNPCMATSGTPALISIYPKFTDNNTYARVNDNVASAGSNVATNQLGFFLGNRTGSSASDLYLNGSLAFSPNAATTAGFVNIDIAINNFLAGATANVSTVGAYTIGNQLTATQISKLYTRLNTFCHDASVGAC